MNVCKEKNDYLEIWRQKIYKIGEVYQGVIKKLVNFSWFVPKSLQKLTRTKVNK